MAKLSDVQIDRSFTVYTSFLAGGTGLYEVVKCGSFGHNIRSRPNMKASPVGRLTMANQITVIEEVT